MKNQILEIASRYENTVYREHELGEKGCIIPHRKIKPQKGLDCSEFIRLVLKEAGYMIPEDLIHAKDFYFNFGKLVPKEMVEPGNLVFFTRRGVGISHIAILVNSSTVIHCSKMYGKVCYSKIEDLLASRFPKYLEQTTKTKFPLNPVGYKTY